MKWIITAIVALLGIVILSAGVLIAAGLLFVPVAPSPTTAGEVEAAQEVSSSFEISGVVTIRVDNPLGEVRVRGAGPEGKVEITATEHAYASSAEEADAKLKLFRFEPALVGDRLTIRPQLPPRQANDSGNSDKIDLLITVPKNTNLDITNELGSTTVSEVTGDITIDSKLGDVNVSQVDGKVHLSADLGAVRISNTALTADSVILANLGDLDFEGKFDGAGTRTFTVNNGGVRITLPADSSFILDAEVKNGQIKSDFDIPAGNDSKTLKGSVGSNPAISLIIRGGNSDIHLLSR